MRMSRLILEKTLTEIWTSHKPFLIISCKRVKSRVIIFFILEINTPISFKRYKGFMISILKTSPRIDPK